MSSRQPNAASASPLPGAMKSLMKADSRGSSQQRPESRRFENNQEMRKHNAGPTQLCPAEA